MDEPTNGLDIPSKTVLRKIIAKSMIDERIILISTHQVKDVENLIDPIIVVENGHIVFNQPTYNISKNIAMEQVVDLNGTETYSQEILGGYQVVKKNRGNDEGVVDLELLFNAIISNPEKVNNLLEGGRDE